MLSVSMCEIQSKLKQRGSRTHEWGQKHDCPHKAAIDPNFLRAQFII